MGAQGHRVATDMKRQIRKIFVIVLDMFELVCADEEVTDDDK